MALANSPLHKVTDRDRWATDNLFGRLCTVAHAAFLYAGFLTRECAGDGPPATTWSVTRRYTLPQLARREDADAVVLILSRRVRSRDGGGAKIGVVAKIVVSNGRQPNARRESRRLAPAAVRAVLSGGLDDTARALRAPGAWLWKLLADGLCRGLFVDLCGRHGVAVGPGFECLPADVKAAILRRLDAAEDVASAACACRELRRVAADHDAELWEARYEALRRHAAAARRRALAMPRFLFGDETAAAAAAMSWKEKYAAARRRILVLAAWETAGSVPVPRTAARVPHRRRKGPRARNPMAMGIPWNLQPPPPPREDVVAEEEAALQANYPEWVTAGNSYRTAAMDMVVESDWYRKGHGAGAVHSPSSRYRWKHR
ncbi:hypothetical protein ACP4OV_003073 [Aristida adscensionis]